MIVLLARILKTGGCDIEIGGVSLLAEFVLLVFVNATLTVSLQRREKSKCYLFSR